MAWTTPVTPSLGDFINAAFWDVQVRDNLLFLYTHAIRQVVFASYTTQTDSSSSTHADTGLTATITPATTSSKILVFAVQAGVRKLAGNASSRVEIKLWRAAVELSLMAEAAGWTGTSIDNEVAVPALYLDSPVSVAALTYKTTFGNPANQPTVRVQASAARSAIMLMELAG